LISFVLLRSVAPQSRRVHDDPSTHADLVGRLEVPGIGVMHYVQNTLKASIFVKILVEIQSPLSKIGCFATETSLVAQEKVP
jgi:hypothetical protein